MTESEDLAAAEALACISCSPPPKALNIFQSPFGEKVSALSPNVRDVTDPDATNSLRGSPGPYMESPMWLLTPFAAENIQSPEVFSGSVSSIPSISSSGDHGARRLFQEDTTVKKEESTKQRRALTIVQNQIKPKSHNKSPIVIKAGKATGAVQRRHLSKSPLKNELDTADLANSSSSSSTSSSSSSSSASRTPLRNGGAGSKTSSPQSTTSPNSLRGSVASPVLARKGGHSTPDSLAYLSADRRNPCNCKKSKCLKLYCECFSANLYCMGCNCLDCANNAEHMTMREQAVKQTLERNPNAFKPKINASPSVGTTQHSHSKGCHCKKSNCLKKYCECFLGEVFCGDNCKCLSCKNYEGSADLKKRRDSNAAKAYNAGMCKFNAGGKGNLPASGLIKLGVAASSLAKEQLPVKRKVPAVERDRDNMFVKKKCVRTSDRG